MKETSVSDRKRVLLVDDEPNLILLVKEYLEFRGYEVIIAESSREALEILDRDLPDLIVSDVLRPEMNGFDFVRIIQYNVLTRSIPFLFLSATGCQLERRIKGLNLGADAFMAKPFEPEELVAQVEALLTKVYRRRSSRKNCFAEGVRQPYIIVSDYSGDYPTQTLVVYPAAGGEEVTTAGYAAAKPLPYYFASELDEYPPSTLVVWVTPFLHQEARAAGYNNAISLPYYFASESDEYPPSTLVVRVWDEEARAAGYDNAVRLNNSLPYIKDLGMLDTEYAAMLQAEEQNSA